MAVAFSLFPVALLLLFVLVPATFLLQVWFIAELKRTEPRAWRLVAEPAWLRWGSGAAVCFIQGGRYRQLQFRKLRRLGAILRLVQAATVLLFLALIAYAFTGLWRAV